MKKVSILLLVAFFIAISGPLTGSVLAQPGSQGEQPGLQNGQRPDSGAGHPDPGPPQEEMKMKQLMKKWAKDRPREEVEAYERAVRVIREKSEVWIQMAHLYMEKKEPQKALETIRKVFAIEIPEGPLKGEMIKKKGHLYLMAVQMAMESGNEAEANTLTQEALQKYSDQPELAFHLYRRMADIQRKKGNPDEALKLLEKAEELINQLN